MSLVWLMAVLVNISCESTFPLPCKESVLIVLGLGWVRNKHAYVL